MRQTGPRETEWIMISSEDAKGLAWFLYLRPCFENVVTRRSHDTVQANSGSTFRQEKRHLEYKNYGKILVANMQHELAYPPSFAEMYKEDGSSTSLLL